MQRILLSAAVAALVLAAAPAAGAKEIASAQVCGPDDCVSVTGKDDRMALMSSGPAVAAPQQASFYNVSTRFEHGDEHGTVSFVAVPRHRAVRYDDGAWYEMTAEQAALFEKAMAGEQAFPAASLVGAAPAPEPKPAAADGSDLLWPEGVLLALVLAAAGVFLVRRWLPIRAAPQ